MTDFIIDIDGDDSQATASEKNNSNPSGYLYLYISFIIVKENKVSDQSKDQGCYAKTYIFPYILVDPYFGIVWVVKFTCHNYSVIVLVSQI